MARALGILGDSAQDTLGGGLAPMGGELPVGGASESLGGFIKARPKAKIDTSPISLIVGRKISETALSFIGEKESYGQKYSSDRSFVLYALGQALVECLCASADRRAIRDEVILGYKQVLAHMPPERDSPLGDDGANIRTPLTWKIRQALHAFFLESITGIRPFIKTEPSWGGDITTANKIEAYYDDLYENQIRFKKKIDIAITLALDEGTSFLKPVWVRETKVIHATDIINPSNASLFGFQSDDQGGYFNPKTGDSVENNQVYAGLREVIIRDTPDLEVVSYFDAFIFPADVDCIDNASIVGHRSFITIDSLRQKARAGMIDGPQLKRLEEDTSLKQIDQQNQTNLGKTNLNKSERFNQDDEVAPLNSDYDQAKILKNSTQRLVEIVELTCRFDADGDELDEDWLVLLETSTKTILKMQPYSNTGLCHLRPVNIYMRPNKLYGQPLPQILEGMQDESDIATNMILDAGALANTVIIEESSSNRDPLDTQDLRVGLNKFTVDEAGKGFLVHQLVQGLQADIFPAREVINSMAADATAANETLVGGISDRPGTTAFETNQALIAGSRRLNVGVDRIREAVWEAHSVLHFITMLHHVTRSNGDLTAKIPYAVRTGSRVSYMDMTLNDFIQPVRFFPLGDGINTNEALKLQAAEKLYLMAERSPFIQNKMERMFSVTSYFLSAYGIKDYSNYIGTVDEARDLDAQAEQKAEQDPMASLPAMPPNIRPEYLAVELAKAGPEAAHAVIQMLQAITEATDTQQQGAEQELAQKDAEMQMSQNEHELELKQQDLLHKLDKAKSDVQAKSQVFSAQQAAQQAQHGAQMKVSQTNAMAQEKVNQAKVAAQQAKTKAAARPGIKSKS